MGWGDAVMNIHDTDILASFHKFYTIPDHGRPVVSQPFELHIKFRFGMMHPAHTIMYFSHGLVNFMVGVAPEIYTI